jgi:hypothetical protein
LIAFLGLIIFSLGAVNIFHNADIQGFFLLLGLFIMIPLGAIVTFYARFFKH